MCRSAAYVCTMAVKNCEDIIQWYFNYKWEQLSFLNGTDVYSEGSRVNRRKTCTRVVTCLFEIIISNFVMMVKTYRNQTLLKLKYHDGLYFENNFAHSLGFVDCYSPLYPRTSPFLTNVKFFTENFQKK